MTSSQSQELPLSPPVAPVSPAYEPLADISLELRTPLTALQAALNLLSSGRLGALSSEAQRMVEIALKNTDRILRLTTAIEQDKGITQFLSSEELALLRLERDLKTALENQEFYLCYQPIVALENHHIIGFEALLRWQHPVHGLIPPDQFIPLAEADDLIVEIGTWVLETACRQLRAWQQTYPESFQKLSVSVNLSSKQLAQPDLVALVGQVLQETGLPSHSLILEITETAVLENAHTAKQSLEKLQQLGVRVYIDDFGTGYSSLSRLYELPLDVLKIDRSFVNRLGSQGGRHLVGAIANLAHNLGAEVVAEGVETAEQALILKSLGCNRGQGYFFAKPMTTESITELAAIAPFYFCPPSEPPND